MRRLFGNGAFASKRTRTQRGTTKDNLKQTKPTVELDATQSISKHEQTAKLFLSKMKEPEELVTMLTNIVYEKAFNEVNKDILRLIRRVTVKQITQEEGESLIEFRNYKTPEEVPEEKEGVYLVMVLMKTLFHYFENEEKAEELCSKMEDIYSAWKAQKAEKEEQVVEEEAEVEEQQDDFTVSKLIEVTGGDKTKTGLTVRCLNQSIAISGHTHVKYKVCPFMTKDISGPTGWQVVITLAEYVQVKHTRREQSIEPSSLLRNHWEIEFDVFINFARSMSEITATKLEIKDLDLKEAMDEDLASYLKKRFNDGSLVVC